jgi:hypothetical protein
MIRKAHVTLLVVVGVILLGAGCGAKTDDVDSKPSYADLVVIYNAELESLDRLERKRADLIAQYQKQPGTNADAVAKSLAEILGTARDIEQQSQSVETTDLESMADQAIEDTEQAKQVATDLLDAIAQPATTDEQANSPEQQAREEEFKRQLAALDADIAKQALRVERARKARDAAEQ